MFLKALASMVAHSEREVFFAVEVQDILLKYGTPFCIRARSTTRRRWCMEVSNVKRMQDIDRKFRDHIEWRAPAFDGNIVVKNSRQVVDWASHGVDVACAVVMFGMRHANLILPPHVHRCPKEQEAAWPNQNTLEVIPKS